jgi:hypothetical protein
VVVDVIISKHAKKRIKKRLSRKHRFEEAIEFGIKAADLKGQFRRYVDKLMIDDKHRFCDVRIYKNIAYLFNPKSNLLITVFPIPHRFHKLTKKLKEKKGIG